MASSSADGSSGIDSISKRGKYESGAPAGATIALHDVISNLIATQAGPEYFEISLVQVQAPPVVHDIWVVERSGTGVFGFYHTVWTPKLVEHDVDSLVDESLSVRGYRQLPLKLADIPRPELSGGSTHVVHRDVGRKGDVWK